MMKNSNTTRQSIAIIGIVYPSISQLLGSLSNIITQIVFDCAPKGGKFIKIAEFIFKKG